MDYDVIIIGGGPGGYIAAERLAHAGKKVCVAEQDTVGGTCLNVGCIPTKSLLNSAKLYRHALESEKFGVSVQGVSANWETMQAWKAQTVATLVGGVRQLLKRGKVDVRNAHASLVGPGKVRVGDEELSCEHVIVATGSVPVMPPIPGAQDNPAVVDSTGLLEISELPKRLVIIGGGVIGVEFASIFGALGTEVHVIEMLPEIVPFMDDELGSLLRSAMPGVSFHLGCQVTEIKGSTVVFTDPEGKTNTLEADVVLMAVGRKPATEGWGADEAGLELDRRGVRVDDTMRTNLPNVWAVGDVTGRSLLAHAAYRMGEIAAAHIIDGAKAKADGQVLREECIPWAVYSLPEAAGVGLTEAQLADQGIEPVTVTVPLVLSGRFVAENGVKEPGAVKLIAEADSRVIRGIHMVGNYAPETIWGAAATLEQELSIDDLRQVIFPHPTVSEGIREAAWAIAD
ncbi:dihydrolipoyl dehydrogenase [Bowdeniella massiliensis]|uniref:dihydrolipoyl dehydrogenase n=1 Tax=Bowdeniella massiliensis TaxID=2932264 RepID=UPI0020292741|nr:dihydrolipoyl dehydrogenase [Bowdeniella massiliensis]